MIPAFSDGFFCINSQYGFLPMKDPLEKLPSSYDCIQNVMDDLSFLIRKYQDSSSFRHFLETQIPNLMERVISETDVHVIAALYRAYCFLSSAYVLHSAYTYFLEYGEYGEAHPNLCNNFAEPLLYLSQKLDVFPWLEYSYGYSLGNYVRIDPYGGLDYENLKMANSFIGTKDEIGFIMVHVDINQHTPDLIRYSDAILEQKKKNEDPEANLEKLKQVLKRMNRSRQKMWKASHWEKYNDFRIFIMGIEGNKKIFPNGLVYGDEDDPRYYRGQSGSQDTIIPFLDTFFRICDYYPDNELTQYLWDMRRYRPKPFRDLLEWISIETIDIITWIMSFPKNKLLLYDIYKEIYDFRNGHWQFVQKYIMKNTTYPIATGGTPILSWIPNQIGATLEAMKMTQTNESEIQELEFLLKNQMENLVRLTTN